MSKEEEKCSIEQEVATESQSEKEDVEKIRVRFGNPALGTYGGCVVISSSEYGDEEEEAGVGKNPKDNSCQSTCLAVMLQVPPEQVPEGVLTVIRAHRNNIFHVRIAIMKADETKLDAELEESSSTSPTWMYLVLFELRSPEKTELFVRSLNKRPFTSLAPDEVCTVRKVIRVEGDDGVNIMSPFFAASLPSSFTGSNEEGGHEGDEEKFKNKRKDSTATVSNSANTLSPNASESPRSNDTDVSTKFNHVGDIQNCAVCLEAMDAMQIIGENRTKSAEKRSSLDSSVEPILTTVCNHSFHINCLLRWQDSPCPVCRYDHSGLNSETLSECHACGKKVNNMVCLICGIVSCAGDSGGTCSDPDESYAENTESESDVITCPDQHPANRGHARAHYEKTLHTYALETDSQHVWDFAGGGYVHRLIRNSEDGKLVEIHDPNNTTSNERSMQPGYLSDAQEEEAMHRKLEDLASQYTTLLKSQLEQQRIYYEGRIREMKREYAQRGKEKDAKNFISALKQKRNHLKQRVDTLRRKKEELSESVTFLDTTNESLEKNKVLLDQQIEAAKKERDAQESKYKDEVSVLEARVAELMNQLDTVNVDVSAADDRKPAARKI